MRAGKLDRTVTIERAAEAQDEYGVVREVWTPLATVRAQVVTLSADELQGGAGTTTETTILFRLRYVAGLTLADRIAYAGEAFDLVETKEIGRRRGLEIRAKRTGL